MTARIWEVIRRLGVRGTNFPPPVGGTGITVNAGTIDAISVRGPTIDGQGGSGTNGIVFNGGWSLTIRDCVVRRNAIGSGNTGNGILLKPNGAGTLTISDSVFESNAHIGISILPTGSAKSGPHPRPACSTRVHRNRSVGPWLPGIPA
jgi:hypothetical protein